MRTAMARQRIGDAPRKPPHPAGRHLCPGILSAFSEIPFDDGARAQLRRLPAAVLPPAASGLAKPDLDEEESVVRRGNPARAARGSVSGAQPNCCASIDLAAANRTTVAG